MRIKIMVLLDLYAVDTEVKEVEIYDIMKKETVFNGSFKEAKFCSYADCEVGYFEIKGNTFFIAICDMD